MCDAAHMMMLEYDFDLLVMDVNFIRQREMFHKVGHNYILKPLQPNKPLKFRKLI